MPNAERLAAYVAHGQFEGGAWSWRRLRWEDPKR